MDENGNRISAVDVWGTRDLGLPPSDSFDPSRHGDRQPLVTGDTFFRLRGNQFIDREDGSRFMLHPDGSFLIQGADEVGVSMDNGVTTIRFRNGDESNSIAMELGELLDVAERLAANSHSSGYDRSCEDLVSLPFPDNLMGVWLFGKGNFFRQQFLLKLWNYALTLRSCTQKS